MNALAEQLSPEPFYDQSHQVFEHLVRYMETEETSQMTHSNLERELEKKGRELMRILLQEHLDNRSPGECRTPVTDSDAIEHSMPRLHERKLETVFGTVNVERTGYGREGTKSLHPMDAELNLPAERYSLELRRRVAIEAAKGSFDETVEHINTTTGAKVPKRQVEELAQRAAQDFDSFYEMRRSSTIPEQNTGSVMVISVDGKGVVMRTQDLREQTRKAAEERTSKMKKRLSKGEKRNAKRMATVAAVYSTSPFIRTPEDLVSENRCTLDDSLRPRPEQKRVWASLEKEPEQVIADALQEADNRDPAHQKIWVALVDGNKNQLSILNRLARKKGIDLTILLDIIHVIEYLWVAGRVFYPEACLDLERWVQKRLLEILRGKAGLVAGGMRRSATRRQFSQEERKPVDICTRYLLNNKAYLQYNQALSHGVPIATGIIEGACRHLVKDRMDVTGARWSLSGAEAVLKLRALRSSHDFDEYWIYHEQCEYERIHKVRYKDGIVPSTSKTGSDFRGSHLRVVK